MSSLLIKGILSFGTGLALLPLNERLVTHICIKLFGGVEFARMVADHPFSNRSRTVKILMAPLALLIGPVQEEVLFRLALQTMLKDLCTNDNTAISPVTGTIKAVILSSACFGLYHFVNCIVFAKSPKTILPQVIATTIVGVVFGIFYELGGLSASIGIHMGYNLRAWLS